jgi:hypothetical protein
MRKFGWIPLAMAAALSMIAEVAMAAGGKAEMLVVVADTRRVDWSVSKYFLDSYNTNPTWFGVECVIITLIMGVSLGFIMDKLLGLTGLDLTSRKIVEH